MCRRPHIGSRYPAADGPRLDMGRLASQLGIAKATLYRWTGPREQLIGEVLSFLSERGWTEALAVRTELEGVDRVLAVARHFPETVIAFEPLRRFVESDAARVSRSDDAWRRLGGHRHPADRGVA
jgi:AcrR family transcriptional regulator